ncbi:MAG: hypothetical protein LBC70_07905 [Chitinispirillales bacterium]|nr:hypothetical protein [Chitinispirillales bacterium]
MGVYIMLDYLKQNSETEIPDLMSTYIYFKFKAYLQTTLTQTKKAYCIKSWKTAAVLSCVAPYDLCERFESVAVTGTNDLRYDIKRAMKQLTARQAEVIDQYFYCGKTELEISSTMRVTRQAVNNIKREALDKLKKILREYAQ